MWTTIFVNQPVVIVHCNYSKAPSAAQSFQVASICVHLHNLWSISKYDVWTALCVCNEKQVNR